MSEVKRYRLNPGDCMTLPDARIWKKGKGPKYDGEYVLASAYDALLANVTAVAKGLRLYVSLPGQPPSVKQLREWLDELEGKS